MADLIIRIKRKADGSAALSCQRADGSVTWQRHDGRQGRFFPLHDLTHYAVERVLGGRRGFYALVAEGWDLTDFGEPWPRGPLPVEALALELVVGFLDSERAAGVEWPAADFNGSAATYYAKHGLPGTCVITDDELVRIREQRRELLAQWAAVPPGDTLELTFVRGQAAA
jgi:hypothetical protein